MDIRALKDEIRKGSLGQRNKINSKDNLKAANTAADFFTRWFFEQDKFKIVSFYIPTGTEISPWPIIENLQGNGIQFCVPVVTGSRMPLVFREWVSDCSMVNGAFGISVPKNGADLCPDLLICPLLAFDAQGSRLGYGGGYYDRTLAHLGSRKKIFSIGLAFEIQYYGTKLPTEPTDIRLDRILTDRGFFL